MRRIGEAWNRFWFSRFDPISVGMFRIWLGVLITVFYIVLFPNWERFYAADGVASVNDPTVQSPYKDQWSVFHWTEGFIPVRVFWWVGFISAVCFTVGWKTRLFTVALFVMACSLLNRSPMVMNGEDVVFRMALFHGMFAPLGHRLSIDSLLRRRRGEPEGALPRIWAIRAMQINFALIYAISLPNKLVDDVAWWNGNALYLAVINSMWSRWPWPGLFYAFDGFLSKVFTYGTILVEGAFPLLVWFRRFRMYVILPLVGLHLGIAVMLNGVTFFTLSMVVTFWIFVPPEITRQALQQLSTLKTRALDAFAAYSGRPARQEK